MRKVVWDRKYCFLAVLKGLLLVATAIVIIWMIVIVIQDWR